MDREFKIQDLIKCVARELKMREAVYPKWVNNMNKKFTREDAEYEIACMRAVLNNLKAQDPEDGVQSSLFGS